MMDIVKIILLWLKTNLLELIMVTGVFIAPIRPLMLTVGFIIAVDFIFGLYRAWSLKEPVTSRKMSNTISKIFLYNMAILTVYCLETFILDGILPITKICAGLLIVTEIKSIDESFEKLFGFSFWKKLARIVRRGESTTKDFL